MAKSGKNGDILGVILAAGKGSRMANLPTRLPKPVLPLLGKPILYHQLECMAALGIREVYIVVGYRGFEVVRELERLPKLDLTIHYLEQEKTLGIAHCVGVLEPVLDRPFLLCLGDIYMKNPNLGMILDLYREKNVDGVLGAIEEPDLAAIRRNFCIIPREDGTVRRVIEKPRHPMSTIKGVGVYFFTPVVFDAIRRTPRTAMRDEYEITDSIQIMIDDGHKVVPAFCLEDDINLTYPRDLWEVNLQLLRDAGKSFHVEPGAAVAGDAVLKNSIVCASATVGKGAKLEDTLVFADAVVEPGAEIRQAIVTPTEIYQVS